MTYPTKLSKTKTGVSVAIAKTDTPLIGLTPDDFIMTDESGTVIPTVVTCNGDGTYDFPSPFCGELGVINEEWESVGAVKIDL